MGFLSSAILLAMAPAPAPGTAPNPTGEMIKMMGMLGIMLVIMYFAMIRPGQKQAREKAELLKAVKAGDKIVTTAGLVAVVITVKDKTLSIRSADSKLEILKTAVSEITEKAPAPAQAS